MVQIWNDGSRTITLLRPVKPLAVGGEIREIKLEPPTLDLTNRWQDGRFSGPMALLSELSNLSLGDLGRLTYPDADIVMAEFVAHLPTLIRQDILDGRVPEASGLPDETDYDRPVDTRDPYGVLPEQPVDEEAERMLRDANDPSRLRGPGFGGPPLDPTGPAQDDASGGIDFGEP